MEKSRAIELLEHLAWDRDIERNPYGDALNMAIEALKAQLSQEGTTKDAISRQQALDIFDDYNVSVEYGELEAYSRDRKRLCELPTIQPEPPIIKCKDCKWWRKQKDSAQGRCRLLGIYPTGAWYCGNAERRTE